jgi:hypothetical protein
MAALHFRWLTSEWKATTGTLVEIVSDYFIPVGLHGEVVSNCVTLSGNASPGDVTSGVVYVVGGVGD